MHKYFQLALGDNEAAWHLDMDKVFADGSPTELWAYCRCELLPHPKTVPFSVFVDGERIDRYHTAFSTTVISSRLARLWERLGGDDVQLASDGL